MSTRNLEGVFRPSSVALVADAVEPGSPGDVVAANLIGDGFRGPIMPVHPTAEAVRGVLAYRTIEELPRTPDLAVIVGHHDGRLPALIEAAGRRGAKAALLVGAGGDSALLPEPAELRRAAAPFRLRLIGPDSLGVIVPRLGLNAGLGHIRPLPGDIAFVTQSGTMLTTVLDWATEGGVGFSHLIALGGMADIGVGDVLDYLSLDGRTRAVLLYVEEIGDVRDFMSAARATARAKPVLILRARTARFGARTADATPVACEDAEDADRVFDAAFRRAGLLRVRGLDELFDAVETLGMNLRVAGERMTILGNGGGLGLLAADSLRAAGGRLTPLSDATLRKLDAVAPSGWRRSNPIDIGGDADGARYDAALRAVLADGKAGAVLVIHCPSARVDRVAAARATLDAVEGARRPVLTSWVGRGASREARDLFAGARVPSYRTPQQAVTAFMHLVRYQRNQMLLRRVPASVSERFAPDAEMARGALEAADGDGRLGAVAAMTLVNAYGLATPERPTPAAGARPLRLRVREERVFGPVLLLDHGAGAARSAGGPVCGLPPLDAVLARDLLDQVGTDLVDEPTLDALALALVRVSQLVVDQPTLASLTLHRLVPGLPEAAVDGVEATRHPPGEARRRLAIRPYPQELETVLTLADGTALGLRPIRPDDAERLQAMVERTKADDLRLRFFTPLASLSPALIARLTQIDYDREMAFVATVIEADDGEAFVGVVRITADPDNRRAEYAVLVRSDFKGKGLGRRLMRAIIRYAEARGIEEVFGEILRENRAMLELCAELGFSRHRSPDDPDIVEVRRRSAIA